MTPYMPTPPTRAAAHVLELARLAALRRLIADRIEADIALLDALDGDPDVEDGGDAEPSLGSLPGPQSSWSRGSTDDREDGDDTGIGDVGGLAEQRGRAMPPAGSLQDAPYGGLRLIQGGLAA